MGNPIKSYQHLFCLCSQSSHLNVVTTSPPDFVDAQNNLMPFFLEMLYLAFDLKKPECVCISLDTRAYTDIENVNS